MCLICIELSKGNLTGLEARRNLGEMMPELENDHVQVVEEAIFQKEFDEAFSELEKEIDDGNFTIEEANEARECLELIKSLSADGLGFSEDDEREIVDRIYGSMGEESPYDDSDYLMPSMNINLLGIID